MSLRPVSVKGLWLRWQSLRLPWRKQWLVGSDLAGNTFWEFKESLNANRMRRIVKYSHDVHYADVKLTPAWMQWLRHTRQDAPSIQEQRLDEVRQANIKVLAAAADERWAARPSLLEQPETSHPEPPLISTHSTVDQPRLKSEQAEHIKAQGRVSEDVSEAGRKRTRDSTGRNLAQSKTEKDQNPWKESEKTKEKQLEAWTPKIAGRA